MSIRLKMGAGGNRDGNSGRGNAEYGGESNSTVHHSSSRSIHSTASNSTTKVTHITTVSEYNSLILIFKHKLAAFLPPIPILRTKKTTVSHPESTSRHLVTTTTSETVTAAMSDSLIEKASLADVYSRAVKSCKKLQGTKYAVYKIQARMMFGMKIGGASGGVVDEREGARWVTIGKDVFESLNGREREDWRLLCAICVATDGGIKLDELLNEGEEDGEDGLEFRALEKEEETVEDRHRQAIEAAMSKVGVKANPRTRLFPNLSLRRENSTGNRERYNGDSEPSTPTPLAQPSTPTSDSYTSLNNISSGRNSSLSYTSFTTSPSSGTSQILRPEAFENLSLEDQRHNSIPKKLRRIDEVFSTTATVGNTSFDSEATRHQHRPASNASQRHQQSPIPMATPISETCDGCHHEHVHSGKRGAAGPGARSPYVDSAMQTSPSYPSHHAAAGPSTGRQTGTARKAENIQNRGTPSRPPPPPPAGPAAKMTRSGTGLGMSQQTPAMAARRGVGSSGSRDRERQIETQTQRPEVGMTWSDHTHSHTTASHGEEAEEFSEIDWANIMNEEDDMPTTSKNGWQRCSCGRYVR